jgi:hypothetical protein
MADPQLPETKDSLWLLVFGPAIWALHFLLSYVTAAVYCAKLWQPGQGLTPVQVAVAVYTALALIGIGITGWRGYRQHRFGTATAPHDFATAADRHRFLGFSTLLLCGLSSVATLYVALAAALVGSCH